MSSQTETAAADSTSKHSSNIGSKLSPNQQGVSLVSLSPNLGTKFHNTTGNSGSSLTNLPSSSPSLLASRGSGGNNIGVGGGSLSANASSTSAIASPSLVNFSFTSNNGVIHQQVSIDETPNRLVYKRMEVFIEKMQDENTGVPIKTVKSFMSKIPSVFTGADVIQWITKRELAEDTCEALHFAHLISSHGYIFPIDDHILTVKNDGTFFRFQTPYYWPSNNSEPENTDYAVYLCKRTMQNKTRLELADYEAENLAKLQKLLSKKWELIYMQAEAQIKVDKKRDKMERKILDSQERAFWDVYRPAPGCVNTTENDIRKTMRSRRTDYPNIGFFRTRANMDNNTSANNTSSLQTTSNNPIAFINNSAITGHTSTSSLTSTGSPSTSTIAAAATGGSAGNTATPLTNSSSNGLLQSSRPPTNSRLSENDEMITLENLKKEREFLKRRLERRYVKTSKVSESFTNYFEQYSEFDPFITPPDPSNPWITDLTELWDMEKSLKDIPQRRIRRWGFSIHELLKDPCGREQFRRFLEREFSSENLRFYEVCNELRYSTNKDIATRVNDIYNEFLASNASCPINIDSRVMAITKAKMENADRYTYDEAREHIFNLMTRDSYNRFLRSETYRESLASAKKKVKPISAGRLSIVRPILNVNNFTS